MEPTSQSSEAPNFVEEEQQQLQVIVEELESVYSEYVSEIEAGWTEYKAAIEGKCHLTVSELLQEIQGLQEARMQVQGFNERYSFAYQQIGNISEQFQRK